VLDNLADPFRALAHPSGNPLILVEVVVVHEQVQPRVAWVADEIGDCVYVGGELPPRDDSSRWRDAGLQPYVLQKSSVGSLAVESMAAGDACPPSERDSHRMQLF
jgi:hypothetical protein